MRQASHHLVVKTRGQGLAEITGDVERWLAGQRIGEGVATLFCRHTSCSLLVQENADPDVRMDVESYFAHIAPEGAGYVHETEGPDDMPAHLRTALTSVSLSIPVEGRKLALGTWQGIYLFEHRRSPHVRDVLIHVIGE
jgi:secondary thiamine-phosphate synthase enzyme